MEMERKRPEILAPAGSIQALKAVIAAGCDAVYMGGSRFGARAYADNPEEEELIRAIEYCHLHGVKLYLTVNTLLKDTELSALYDFFLPYYEAGVDAVLVQDMGVMRTLHDRFPELALHASTQMTITQGKMAEFYKEYGVTRIVPARELSLLELKRMREETEAELEVFVHGALCCSFSGQCLFSSMLGGRSGNRGRCAQPCRQQYRLETSGRKGYFLSPRELCALSYIGELMETRIDSFKIEGRMKRAEYAAFVTSVYKKYTELYASKGKEGYLDYLDSHQEEWERDIRNLADFYNREGFTSGYLAGEMGDVDTRHPGKRGEMLSFYRPRHGGVLVGRVIWAGTKEVEYEALEEIGAQDVVEFRRKDQETLYEYTLGKPVKKGERVRTRYKQGMTGKDFSGQKSRSGRKDSALRISVGDFVYRTKNQALLQEVGKRFLEQKIQIPVFGNFQAEEGKRPSLQVRYGEYLATAYGEVCEPAKSQPVTEDFVRKTLGKTGESLFCFRDLEISLEKNLFLSVGTLKTLRREAFDLLKEEVLKTFRRKAEVFGAGNREADDIPDSVTADCEKSKETGTKEFFLTASVMNGLQLEEVLLKKEITRIYLHTELMDVVEISKAAERIRTAGKSPWIVMPAIFREGIGRIFGKEGFADCPVDGFLVRNGESLLFLKEWKAKGPDREIQIGLDAGMYCMNEEAYRFYQTQADFMTLPLELTREEMGRTSFAPFCEFVGYGRTPLMISAQCLQANTEHCVCGEKKRDRKLRFSDEKKRSFVSVNYCKYCYNIIYQDKPVYIGEILEDRMCFPVQSFRYAFTTESREEVREVLRGAPPFETGKGHFYKGIE